METQPKVDSTKKSPLSNAVPPSATEDKSKNQSSTTTAVGDQKSESKDKVPCTSQPEASKSECHTDAKKGVHPETIHAKGKTSNVTEDQLSHPIISVDIQKTMPYENKQVVPQESQNGVSTKKQVSPEVLASVVTTAVVNEAALTVSDADGFVKNGTKLTSDSSKVHSVVEQELNKLGETMNGKAEPKIVDIVIDSSKALPNGDIDHSPGSETVPKTSDETKSSSTSESRKETKQTPVVEKQDLKKSLDQTPASVVQTVEKIVVASKDSSETQSKDSGTCNGVPGIITVVGISKKESAQASKSNSEKDGLATDSKKTGDTKTSEAEKIKEIPPSDNTKSDEQESSKTPQNAQDALKNNDKKEGNEKKSVKQEKDELKSDSNSKSEASTNDKKLMGDDLTDSAKLQSNARKVADEMGVKSSAVKELKNTEKKDSDSENKDVNKSSDAKRDIEMNKDSLTKLPDNSKIIDEILSDKNVKNDIEKSQETSKVVAKAESGSVKDIPKEDTVSKGSEGDTSSIAQTTTVIESVDNCNAQQSSSNKDISKNIQHPPSVETKPEPAKQKTESVENMSMMMTSQILTEDDLKTDNLLEKQDEKLDAVKSETKPTKDSESKPLGNSDVQALKMANESCRISASRYSPETCDVGSGQDEINVIRVASGDGGEEEVDGQQATAEVEVTDENLTSNTDDINNATSPTSGSPSGGRSSQSSKTASAVSRRDATSPADDPSKPTSAASRSSIPDAIVYEPPERRKSAASVTNENKDDSKSEKSQADEKETEKTPEDTKMEPDKKILEAVSEADLKDLKDNTKVLETNQVTAEKDDNKKADKTDSDNISISKTQAESKENVSFKTDEEIPSESEVDDGKSDKIKDMGGDNEKGGKDAKETEGVESKPVEKEEIKISEKKEIKESDQSLEKYIKGTNEKLVEEELKETENELADTDVAKGKSDSLSLKSETKEEVSSKTPQPAEDESKAKSETELNEERKNERTEDKNYGISEEIHLVDEIVPKESEEPRTLVEEQAPVEESSSPKEALEPEEKEEDETEKELTPEKEGDDKGIDQKDEGMPEEGEVKEEQEIGGTGESEAMKNEEKEKVEDEEKSDEQKPETEEVQAVDNAKSQEEIEEKSAEVESAEKIDEDISIDKPTESEAAEKSLETESVKKSTEEESAEKLKEEESTETPNEDITTEKSADEKQEVEGDEDKEKAEEAKEGEEQEVAAEKKDADEKETEREKEKSKEAEEQEEKKDSDEKEDKPEPPPRSPTKRVRSPDKAGRRGVSPISSPPKSMKTPPSPQKPQKTTSPKKKNGMLSPIKTPKTPGSDTRKLPPIKAPVGLAPNPNLKNIRSKIGSFDNIRYKPGGGDKKVISTKKLEWKAAPKIGSLDHSYKEKKHGRSHSKGEPKDQLPDGQSPQPSGDEGEQEVAAAEAAETLIKPEGSTSTEMPVAITAES